MPEVVDCFIKTSNLNEVLKIQNRIVNSIKSDFGRYKTNEDVDKINETLKLRAEACFDSLPSQLSKEYKKFPYSLVDCKGHSNEKADGLQYLYDLGLVLKTYNLSEIQEPLLAHKKN